MLKETISEFVNKIYPSKQTIKLRSLLWAPLKMLAANFKTFIILSFPFAFVLMLLSLILNTGISCSIIPNQSNGIACASAGELPFLLFQILRLILVIFFIKLWYKYTIAKQPTELLKLLIPTWQDAKSFFLLIFFIFINFVPAVSYYALLVREPNPNWQIESLYFLFVSTGFVIPFLALLYYVVFSYVLEGEKCPPFKQMSAAIFDNSGKIMISTLFVITLGLLLIIYYISLIIPHALPVSNIKIIMFEIFYNITILVFAALMTNYLFNLRDTLFPTDKKK